MIIKVFHRKKVIADLLVILLFIVLSVFLLLFERHPETSDYYVVIICALPVTLVVLHDLGFESKEYGIDHIGICVTWLGIIKHYFKWEDFIAVSLEHIEYFWGPFEEDSIICSTIPLKRRNSENVEYRKIVDLGWIRNRQYKVVTILLKDLKPDQYEEFWSYVPERFKT